MPIAAQGTRIRSLSDRQAYQGLTPTHFSARRPQIGAQWKAKPKEAAANARGKIFGKLVKEIMLAARNGADPDMNPKLRLAVHQAKKASMPKDTLDRAIKKGAGLSGEVVNY